LYDWIKLALKSNNVYKREREKNASFGSRGLDRGHSRGRRIIGFPGLINGHGISHSIGVGRFAEKGGCGECRWWLGLINIEIVTSRGRCPFFTTPVNQGTGYDLSKREHNVRLSIEGGKATHTYCYKHHTANDPAYNGPFVRSVGLGG
jgi:hypothetical protein